MIQTVHPGCRTLASPGDRECAPILFHERTFESDLCDGFFTVGEIGGTTIEGDGGGGYTVSLTVHNLEFLEKDRTNSKLRGLIVIEERVIYDY